MKERPILFSGEMIRALLAGAKTQTRRVVKLPNGGYIPPSERKDPNGWRQLLRECKYGQPGDRLWVRETCRAEELESGQDGVRYLADNHFRPINDTPGDAIQWMKMNVYGKQGGTNVPSIHMPRWACRLVLEITDIRAERLQDISEADAVAEGGPVDHPNGTARGWFEQLWEKLYGAGSWDANPYVWRISFKKVEA
ncbi:hypothetical protein [Chromobacterium haemolyticum]|uniref:hypothetical protein n=1 Tax=Chromobacterium haemolyticum TaxID=394935 RepID=UPI0002F7FC9F|nr:hypothetical protein [Chromobacterium haemolyticum]